MNNYGSGANAPGSAIEYAERGLTRLRNGEFDKAIADFDMAIRLDPNYAEAYKNRGNAYIGKGNFNQAIADYTEAIRCNPNYTVAYHNRGNANSEIGKLNQAIADYTRSIELDPGDAAMSYNSRGHRYLILGNKGNAVADFNEAIRLDPNYADAYYNLGNAQEDPCKAIVNYNLALELNPDYAKDPDFFYNRGCTYSKKGERDKAFLDNAIADYDRAIELDKNYAKAYRHRGNAYYAKGEIDKAIKEYNKAIEFEPGDAFTYYLLGMVYEYKGDNAEAIKNYNKAMELNPDYTNDTEFCYSCGNAYYALGRGELDKVIATNSAATKLDTNYVKKCFDNAIESYTTVIDKLDPPDNADACLRRGKAYYLNGEIDKAKKDFKKALDIRPDFREAQIALAELTPGN
jgi:tetratricopeptide (TPR) repeat protein